MAMKICRDCQYFSQIRIQEPLCHYQDEIDLVLGRWKNTKAIPARAVRASAEMCGTSGLWFKHRGAIDHT